MESLLNAIPAPVFYKDTSGYYLGVNRTFEKYFGQTSNEIIGKSVFDIAPKELAEIYHAKDMDLLEHREVQVYDSQMIDCYGGIHEVTYHKASFLDTDGKLLGLIGVILDITERKKAEERLAQTRQNYESFFNTIDEFLFVLDVQGNIIHCNKTVLDRLGYSEEELIGKSVLMVHPQERREEAGRIVTEMLEGKTEFCPVPIITESGIQIPVETRVTQGFWDGKPVIFGVSKDISPLRLSEEKYSKLFYNNQSACGLDELETGRYIEVNDAFYKLFGFTREEVIGKSALDLGILTHEAATELINSVREKNRISNVEISLRAKNGDIKHVLLSGETIFIQDKKYRYTIVDDITERKQIEKELIRSEAMFELFFNQSYMGFYFMMTEEPFYWNSTIDKEKTIEAVFKGMKFTKVNKALLDQYHASEADFIGKSLNDQFAGKPKHGRKVWTDFLDRGKNIRMETNESKIDGKAIVVEGDYNCMYDEKGRIFGIFGVQLDITARKKVAADLIESEAKFKDLFEANTDGITILRLNEEGLPSEIIDMNENAAKIVGYSKQEMLQINPERFEIPPTPEKSGKRINDIKQNGSITFETKLLHKDGREMDVEIKVLMINYKNQLALMTIARDITERKNSEIQLQKFAQELSKQIAEKDKFFSIIAHDLRGPIGGFMGLTEIMASEITEMTMDELQNIACTMKNTSTNIYNLLGNLLEWSRLQRGLTSFEPISFVLLPKVLDMLSLTLDLAIKKEITISNSISGDLVVFADENMLASIIRNFVSNSVKFTPKGGKIHIGAMAISGKFIEISISDNGIGMDQNMIENLFNTDVDSSRKGTEGELSTGMGLILCKEFIAKQGGELRVESEVDHGNTFYFTLPTIGE